MKLQQLYFLMIILGVCACTQGQQTERSNIKTTNKPEKNFIEPLELKMQLYKNQDTFYLAEPIYCSFTLQNVSKQPILIGHRLALGDELGSEELTLEVKNKEGVMYDGYKKADRVHIDYVMAYYKALKPKDKKMVTYDLNEIYPIIYPGEYTLRATYKARPEIDTPKNLYNKKVYSNWKKITILPKKK